MEELLLCKCGDPSHHLIMFYNHIDKEVYVTVHLNDKYNFFKRIWVALKYVFGRKRSIYGDFDDIILRTEDAHKLQYAVDILESNVSYKSITEITSIKPS